MLSSDACAAIPKLLITVGGKAVITLSIDISNNISKIQTKQKLHPSKSETLQSMIHLEIGMQIWAGEAGGCCLIFCCRILGHLLGCSNIPYMI